MNDSMSFLDKVGNRVDKMRSKQSENSDINSFNKQIKEEKDAIDIIISRIGEYYWNLYAEDKLDPPEDVALLFEDAANRVKHVNELEEKIDERRKEGVEQRIEIDKNTQVTEERKAAEAAERKRQREEAKRLAAEEKAAQKAAEEATSEDEQQ